MFQTNSAVYHVQGMHEKSLAEAHWYTFSSMRVQWDTA